MELKIGDNVIFRKQEAKIFLLPDKARKAVPNLCLIGGAAYGWYPSENVVWNYLNLNPNKKYWWVTPDVLILDKPAKKRKFV